MDPRKATTRCTETGEPCRPLLELLLLLLVFSLPIACQRQERTTSTADGQKLKVVTTVAPITSVVENVAGDTIELVGLVPEGVNSHTFEPTPSDVKILAAADLIILNGVDLEVPSLNLAKTNKKPGTAILLLGNKAVQEEEYAFDFSFPKEGGHPNPHLWINPQYVTRYVMLVRDELIRLDPANRRVYERNTAVYLEELEALDRAIDAAVRTIPAASRRLLTYHDSWPYFARRYGFTVIGAVQPSDFSDPSPREVARLIEQIRKEKIPAVFGSEVFPSPILQQIARETKTRYIDKLRDDELPGKPGDPRHSYIGMMLENVAIMVEALGGSAAPLAKVDPGPVAGSYGNYRRKD
ncbi:MAG: zinc ABC transporter substrate-binding protein [Deltaproteobacteria bacterium]|nr:zinc ABC transporter substrate-binding protein [Deltaproteobacteria bacterium]